MIKIVYHPAAEFDLSRLISDHQQKVREWERTVQLPDQTRVGYLRDQVGPVQIWFQVENNEIRVCDIRVID
jgi:mRNA-degrading endonuclease RelE of RelBE toxin-antitoxin system